MWRDCAFSWSCHLPRMARTKRTAPPSHVVYAVAAAAKCDHKIARRALIEGVASIRIVSLREALERAIASVEGAQATAVAK